MKIFVTVGTQLPFDRLVRAMDAFQRRHPEHHVFAQIGAANFVPAKMKSVRSLTREDFTKAVADADIVVAHAGIGSVLTALDAGKRLIVMPRLCAHGEHRNDHQIATASELSRFRLVSVANDDAELRMALAQAVRQPASDVATTANPSATALVTSIAAFIDAPAPRRRWRGAFAAAFGTPARVTK